MEVVYEMTFYDVGRDKNDVSDEFEFNNFLKKIRMLWEDLKKTHDKVYISRVKIWGDIV